MKKKNTRMRVIFNKDEGLKVDLPYSGWLMFCCGASLLITSIRWW